MKQPERILITADPIGGVWPYTLELARGLASHGVEIALATMGQPLSKEQQTEAASLRNLILYESRYKLEWMQDPWEDLARSSEWLLSLAEELRPDLVHLNGYVHACLPWNCPCLVVAHSCVLSWWDAVRREGLPESLRTYQQRVSDGLSAANLVIAPTAAMLKELERFYLPLRNGLVIHNGRNADRFSPGKKKDFVLSVGRVWDEAKNIAAVAKVAPTLSWPIYVAGEASHPDGGTVALPNVHCLGQLGQQKLASWFATASVFAHPARYEPFGLTVLEAAMSGCALVLGDIPSLRELWQDAAIFVPPDDAELLANEIRGLCRDQKRLNCLAQRAYHRSRSFSSEKKIAKYLTAYRSVMAGRGRELTESTVSHP